MESQGEKEIKRKKYTQRKRGGEEKRIEYQLTEIEKERNGGLDMWWMGEEGMEKKNKDR